MPSSLALLLAPFGVDFFCLGKKYLVFNMVSRNLKSKYHRSVLGVFWTLVNPLAMALVYYFVFKGILRVKQDHYLVFILCGQFPWNFFVQSLMEGLESLVGNLGLISKVPVPIQIFPFVGAVTNLVTLFLSLPILLGVALISHLSIGIALVCLPYYLVLLFLMCYSISLVLSIAFVFFRDLRHLMSIVMQVWFFATPVIYADTMIPERYHWIIYANPVGTIFVGLHRAFVDQAWPSQAMTLVPLAWVAVFVSISIVAYKGWARGIVEQI